MCSQDVKTPEDFQLLFQEDMQVPGLTKPDNIAKDIARKEEIIWTASMKSYVRQLEELKSNLIPFYALIWGQHSEAMQNKIQALDHYNVERKASNCNWILKEIEGVTHQFDTK
jgi:hypothetical protein